MWQPQPLHAGSLPGQRFSGSLNHRLGRCERSEYSHPPQAHFFPGAGDSLLTKTPPGVCSTYSAEWWGWRGGAGILDVAIPHKSMWKLLCVYLVGMLAVLPLCLCPFCVCLNSSVWSVLAAEGRGSEIALGKSIYSELAYQGGGRQRQGRSSPEGTVQRERAGLCRPICGCEIGRAPWLEPGALAGAKVGAGG